MIPDIVFKTKAFFLFKFTVTFLLKPIIQLAFTLEKCCRMLTITMSLNVGKRGCVQNMIASNRLNVKW